MRHMLKIWSAAGAMGAQGVASILCCALRVLALAGLVFGFVWLAVIIWWQEIHRVASARNLLPWIGPLPAVSPASTGRGLLCTLVAAALLISTDSHALSRRGLATTSLQSGDLCFSLIDPSWLFKDRFVVRGLAVSDPAVRQADGAMGHALEIWSFHFESKAHWLQVDAEHCFAYGQAPEFAKPSREAPALVLNKRYHIEIGAEPVGSRIATYGYGGSFCLVADSAGTVRALSAEASPETRVEMDRLCPTP